MKNTILALTIISFGLTTATTVNGSQVNPIASKIVAIDLDDTSASSTQQCSDSEQAMSSCRSFIKGFLQGALLTDTAIIKSIENTEPSFTERAFRTRLGKRSNSPTALAGFCLPADRSMLELAQETLDHVKASERNSAELAKNVYNSLKVDYPCG